VQRLSQFSANAIMNLAKSFSTIHTSNPSLLIAILQETLVRLPQVQGQALCNALQGAATAAASPTYASYADVIRDITSQLCNHLATRVHELKQAEVQQLSMMLRESRICVRTTGGRLLEQALADPAHRGEEYFEDGSSDRSRQNSDDVDSNEDLQWPTAGSLWSCSTTLGDSGPSTPILGAANVNFIMAPEKLQLASALPVPPLLDDTFTLLAVQPAAGNLYLMHNANAQGPGAPKDITNVTRVPPLGLGLEDMPWKVPLPSDGVATLSTMPAHVSTDGGTAPNDADTAKAQLVASLHALITASVSGLAGVGNNGQTPCPASEPIMLPLAPPGLPFTAPYH
jgi:hypothetical protein